MSPDRIHPAQIGQQSQPAAQANEQRTHFPPPPPPPPQMTDSVGAPAAAAAAAASGSDAPVQQPPSMRSMDGNEGRGRHMFPLPPPPPPPPPYAAAAVDPVAPPPPHAAPAAASSSPWMRAHPPTAQSQTQLQPQSWISTVPTLSASQHQSAPDPQSGQGSRAPVEMKWQPMTMRTAPRALHSFGALQPLHPTLARHRPVQLINFVSKQPQLSEAGSAAAAASSPAPAADSSASPPIQSATTASSSGAAPLSRLDRKLQQLLRSLLEASPDGSMRLRDLAAAVEARGGGGAWEDRTTEPLLTFLQRRLHLQGHGPFRLQADPEDQSNPLVSCGDAEVDEGTRTSSERAAPAHDAVPSAASADASSATAAAVPAAASAASASPSSTIPLSSSSFRSYCVLVSNIPASFHSSDLRHFFSNFVEAGRFKVFQPAHRADDQGSDTTKPDGTPDRVGSHSSASAAAAAAAASGSGESGDGSKKRRFESIASSALPPSPAASRRAGRPWKCMVQLRKKADVERMLQEYDGAEWVSRKGLHTGEYCRLRFVPLPRRLLRFTQAATAAASCDLTDETNNDDKQHAKEVIDLCDDEDDAETSASVPAATTAAVAATSTAAAAADRSTSDAAAASALEVEDTPEEVAATREILDAYNAGEFAAPAFLPYGLVGTPTRIIHANIAHLPTSLVQRLHLTPATQMLNAKRFKFDYEPTSSYSSSSSAAAAAAAVPAADVDDDPFRLDARARARTAAELDEQEEWDREMDQGERSGAFDSGRGLGRVGDSISYEDDVDNPWDKGDASGLVHYTDAQRERANEGDFDERTTDMFDVDDGEGDAEAFDSDVQEESEEARAQRRHLAAVKMRERMAIVSEHSERVAAEAHRAASTATRDRSMAWSKSSFLSRMMSKMGYEEGRGLGKHGQGIAEAIQPVNRGAARGGLGFVNQPQRGGGAGSGAQRHQQQQQRKGKFCSQHQPPRSTPKPTASSAASSRLKRVF